LTGVLATAMNDPGGAVSHFFEGGLSLIIRH